MKGLVVFACALAVLAGYASCQERTQKVFYDLAKAKEYFEKFKSDYHRRYADKAEEDMRFDLFVKSLKLINDANVRSSTATFDINNFADRTVEEMQSYFLPLA